ncbi:MAG: ATPase, partial [Candidatus Omnitrophica bacterium]|nr:ATPase [Candidatus Omnitrophota bacterium]
GQDAEDTAAQRIMAGTQAMTVFKNTREQARVAIETAIKMVRGEKPETNSVDNNKKMDVPSILLTPVVVDKANIDEVLINSGYISKDKVYKK